MSRAYLVLDHVHHRDVDGETVILDSRSDDYLGLNVSATVVWNAIVAGEDIDGAARALAERFQVDLHQAQEDAASVVQELLSRGLIARPS